MDLPTELRLHIAGYALVSQKPLTWYWSEYTETNKSGSFRHFKQTTALTRVCRQVRAETVGIVWKVNELHFQSQHFGPAYWELTGASSVRLALVSSTIALLLFFQRVGPSVYTKLPSVIFGLWTSPVHFDIESFNVLDSVAKLLPPGSLKLQYCGWGVFNVKEDTVAEFIDLFVATGRELRLAFETIGLELAGRNWRVVSAMRESDKKMFRDNMTPEMHREALEWAEHEF